MSVIRYEYLDIKNCSSEKRLIGCEDEILNTNEASPDNKEEICKKSNFLIYTILLVVVCLLLLAVIYYGCYYYYNKDWIKKEHILLY